MLKISRGLELPPPPNQPPPPIPKLPAQDVEGEALFAFVEQVCTLGTLGTPLAAASRASL